MCVDFYLFELSRLASSTPPTIGSVVSAVILCEKSIGRANYYGKDGTGRVRQLNEIGRSKISNLTSQRLFYTSHSHSFRRRCQAQDWRSMWSKCLCSYSCLMHRGIPLSLSLPVPAPSVWWHIDPCLLLCIYSRELRVIGVLTIMLCEHLWLALCIACTTWLVVSTVILCEK